MLIGLYSIFYIFDIEGMKKFILEVNFLYVCEIGMNDMSKGGVKVCHPCGSEAVALVRHAFIECFLEELNCWKVSAIRLGQS